MRKLFLLFVISSLFSLTLRSDWVKLSSHPTVLTYDILISGNTIYTASYNGINKSTDGTASWIQVNSGLINPQALQCNQVILSGVNLYAATVDGVYKSTDNGSNWTKKSDGIFVGNGALYAFSQSIYEINGALLTGAYTGLYRSTNGGENWLATNITGMHIWAKNFTLYNGVLFAARESGNVPGSYKSTDNGVTWIPFSIQGLYLPAITFFNDGSRLYSGTIDGVWLSTDNGVNWTVKNTGLSLDPYSSSIIRVNGALLTSLKFGGSGIYKSFNNGDTWLDFKQGLPFLSEIHKLIVFNNKILAASSDGLYQRDISEVLGVSQISSEVPESFSLSQNYPNPFNPETKIQFNIPLLRGVDAEGGRGVLALLKVYDITGREVITIVNENLQPGTYEVSFDGSKLSSGVYYYTLQAGDPSSPLRITKKMILAK